jgi:hypothetical protein
VQRGNPAVKYKELILYWIASRSLAMTAKKRCRRVPLAMTTEKQYCQVPLAMTTEKKKV